MLRDYLTKRKTFRKNSESSCQGKEVKKPCDSSAHRNYLKRMQSSLEKRLHRI